jgi:hypothetical protein
MGSRRSIRVSIVFVLLVVTTAFSQTPRPASHEQTDFCADELPERPVPLPKSVLKLLLARQEVQDSLSLGTDEQQAHPARFFHASKVHLGPDDEVGLVVIGSPPISGADNDWFWVVRFAFTNPKVVLWEGANCISFDQGQTNGLHNISSSWASASERKEVTYRFDGAKYKAGKPRWSKNTAR